MKLTRTFSVAALLASAITASALGQEQKPASIIAAGAKVEKVAGDFKFTEGCASDAEGNVYFTDQPNDKIVKWSVDGKVETWMSPSGRANGLFVDPKGNIIACADEKNEMWVISPDKKVEVIIKDYKGKLLNAPNDVWARPDGGIYFTDPMYRRDYWKRGGEEQDEGSKHHVYFLSPDRKTLSRVTNDLTQPNGIIGTPDGKMLYVSDINAGKTYSYTIKDDGTLADKKLFCTMGSDGMTIDDQGNVYLTNGVTRVFAKDGKKIEEIRTPESPANVCFGGKDKQTLFICARSGFYSIKMNVKGVGSQ
jgi:gluconolactonase